jgi:hypothetical protein
MTKRVEHPVPKDKKWTQQPDGSWKCDICSSDILAVLQYRSVWLSDGPGPCAGTGEVEHHVIPYCPKCDPKPSDRGVTHRTMAEDIAENLY